MGAGSADEAFLARFTSGTVIGGYLLEGRLGQGGMASVFLATDTKLGRRVALKIMADADVGEGFRRRFLRESRLAAAVDDPHIIPVHDAGEDDGVLYLAMRYVPGGDARTLLAKSGRLSPERVAAIISPVASALDAAHGAGLVHRDVKPANILIDGRPGRPDHVYLADFGIAKAVSRATTALTGTGNFVGTLDYIAPEQIRAQELTGAADQYALACTAYELLTGQPPFVSTSPASLIAAHLLEPAMPPSARDAGLVVADPVFARALAKDPAARYPACRDFADDLRSALGMAPYSSGPSVIPSQPVVDNPLTRIGHHAGADETQDLIPIVSVAAETGSTAGGNASAVDGITDDNRRSWHIRRHRFMLLTLMAIGILAVGTAAAVILSNFPGHGTLNPPSRGSTSPSREPTGRPRYALIGTLTDPYATPVPSDTSAGAIAVAFSPNGVTLAVGDNNGRTYLWDAASEHLTATLTDPVLHKNRTIASIAFSPDGHTLAVNASFETYLWDFRTRTLIATLHFPRRGGAVAGPVAFSPTGRTLATGGGFGDTYIWNAATGSLISTLHTPGYASPGALAFSPSGQTLAINGTDNSTYLYNLATRRLTVTFTNPARDAAFGVAFSFNGQTLATGDNNGSVYLWDIAKQDLSATLNVPGTGKHGTQSLAFSPDGRTLADADYGGSIFLWEVATGKLSATLTEPAQYPLSLSFSPAGKKLATCSPYGSAYLWNVG